MSRNYFPIISFALAALVAPLAHQAIAQGTPTADQLDAAKKAYGEGKLAHDAGKLPEAIEKFKESYRLSRNPVLLYNIAFTLDENKQTDNALFYYRKFLSDAPADAAQRKTATERVKTLENEKLDADLAGTPAEKPPETAPTKPVEGPVKKDVKIKPAGTYAATEFQHQVVEDAPPGKALDISAFVPEDSGWTVTLYYRAAGESTFVAKPMVWHYKQLIARIPAVKVTGTSIQYYVEARDQAGTSVAKSGKSTSPNLVNLDASVQPRFFPDFSDDSTPEEKTPAQRRHHDDEDPLNKNKHTDEPVEPAPIVTGPAGEGPMDVGSAKFEKLKLGTTIGAAAFLGLGIGFYVLAGNQASALVDDTKTPHGTCTQTPCPFDSYDADLQAAGQRDQTISNITLGVGIIGAAVAGYFWYKDVSHKHASGQAARTGTSSLEMTWMVAPTVGDHYQGAAAAVRF